MCGRAQVRNVQERVSARRNVASRAAFSGYEGTTDVAVVARASMQQHRTENMMTRVAGDRESMRERRMQATHGATVGTGVGAPRGCEGIEVGTATAQARTCPGAASVLCGGQEGTAKNVCGVPWQW